MTRRDFLRSALVAGAGVGLARGQDGDALAGLVNQETQEAINQGLEFLSNRQGADGSFGTGALQGNVGITGLAGLAFMAGGHQPGRGRYGLRVRRALEAVLASEDPGIPGYLHRAGGNHLGGMYGHGFAALFLAEVHGMISDPGLRGRVRATLGRSIALLQRSQSVRGGWRYHPNDRDDDVSATICQMMALRAARNAGVYVPKTTADNCIRYVKNCQDPVSGGFCYQPGAGGHFGPGFARTAAGLVALYSAGLYDDEAIRKGLEFLQRFQPGGNQPNRFASPELMQFYYYGHYYAAQAMWIAGPERFVPWYRGIRNELLGSNDRNRAEGSWYSVFPRADMACPHMHTAMALIILQIPNNYLPILHR